jgi:hypothetical protein
MRSLVVMAALHRHPWQLVTDEGAVIIPAHVILVRDTIN